MFTNGTFDSDVSGWDRYTTDATITLSWDSGGKAKLVKTTSSPVNVGIDQAITKPSGVDRVRVRGDIVLNSGSLQSGEFVVRNPYGSTVNTGLTGSGSFDVTLPIVGSTDNIAIYGYANVIDFTLDNLTCTYVQAERSNKIISFTAGI